MNILEITEKLNIIISLIKSEKENNVKYVANKTGYNTCERQ